MNPCTAEEIVAGSRELDRREAVINELMRMLCDNITQEYREYPSSNAITSLGVSWSRLKFDSTEFEIHTITDHRRSDFGLVAVFYRNGVEHSRVAWYRGSQRESLSCGHIHLLWDHRNEIVAKAVRAFPKIEEHLVFFASYASEQ